MIALGFPNGYGKPVKFAQNLIAPVRGLGCCYRVNAIGVSAAAVAVAKITNRVHPFRGAPALVLSGSVASSSNGMGSCLVISR